MYLSEDRLFVFEIRGVVGFITYFADLKIWFLMCPKPFMEEQVLKILSVV